MCQVIWYLNSQILQAGKVCYKSQEKFKSLWVSAVFGSHACRWATTFYSIIKSQKSYKAAPHSGKRTRDLISRPASPPSLQGDTEQVISP